MVVKIKWNYLRNNYNLLNDIEIGLNYVTLFENNCNKGTTILFIGVS